MGNCLTSEKPQAAPSSMTELSCAEKPPNENQSVEPTTPSSSSNLPEELGECIDLFREIQDKENIDELINKIQQILQRMKSKLPNNPENGSTSSQPAQEGEEESGIWKSIIRKGSEFLERLNNLAASEKLHQGIKVVAETLTQVGQINSTVAGLSAIAFVLSKYEKMRDNQPDCLQALGDLIDLARHLRSLKKIIPAEEEKYTKAIHLIVEGSITCLRQSEDNKLFRFIKSSINSESLMNLQKRINELYPNLVLTSIIELRKDIATRLPIAKPVNPGAVGIERQVNEIVNILTTSGNLSLAVVIYGFGGLGKTTMAEAIVSKIDLSSYKYTMLQIYQESEKNDFTKLQKQILQDCFPDYNHGQAINLRDCKDGGRHLMKAFQSQKEKPIFLYIDNALRSEDLENLLPEDLGDLPQGSRILVTTRQLQVTDHIFEGQSNLERRDFPVQPLPNEDASKILFKDPAKAETIKEEDLNRILTICSGVPLALKIVGAHLHKQGYSVERCTNILENLERGGRVKEEKLTDRIVDFTYHGLEGYSQEALLDMCCFFNDWNRQVVEHIVGAGAVTSLLEAGLISSAPTPHRNHPAWDKLIVHDIIKGNGLRLAEGNRIFDVQSLREAAKKRRLDQIKGVWLVEDKSQVVIREGDLNAMRASLRVLALGERMKASRVSQMRFEELRFLKVSNSIPQLPVKLENLDTLKVFHGPFFNEGEVTLCKMPKDLKAIKVHGPSCNSEMTGAITCSSLKILHFNWRGKLPKLPEGFNRLMLEVLILDYNYFVKELPEEICQLPALKVLSMRDCGHLECLPQSFGQLTTLEYLDLSSCMSIETLPESFRLLTNLQNLSLSACASLRTLPESFGLLTNLQNLSLSECDSLRTLPDSFGQLTALRKVYLFGCPALGALRRNFGHLAVVTDMTPFSSGFIQRLPMLLSS